MGLIHAQIELSNPKDGSLKPIAVRALVIGDSVLMGAVPMEDMDLVVSPAGQTVTVNPKSPNIPSALVK